MSGFCCRPERAAIDMSREDALDSPGSSLIWLGCDRADPKEFVPNGDPAWRPVKMPETYVANTRMHLNAAQVKMLIETLQSWLDTGAFDRADWPDVIGEQE